MERRLAAILLTDMVGYSRLIGLDEEGTIARQRVHREEVIDPEISEHGGRIVKTTGDGLLVEFPSVVDAVRCAVEVQTELADRDTDVPKKRRIQYRIGINLGDVVADGDDILGDGVNVAARLEGLAQPGGICISGTVYDQLAGKLELAFKDAGEQTVKNVPRPVRVWHWQADQPPGASTLGGEPMPLPDKPSIAVLPFANMSGDPEQEFFTDGITEDIITGLSRFHSLFVIARNSTFSYKGKSVDVRQVAGDLGVRYVLEGSVRRSGNRVRIVSQLIDAATGNHIWAERYDHEMEDIFTLQDEVTNQIIATIAPEIDRVERERAQSAPPNGFDAWSRYHRGMELLYSAGDDQTILEAINWFDQVNQCDPMFARGFAMAATARLRLMYRFEYSQKLDCEHLRYLQDEALERARRAIQLDPRDSVCLYAYGNAESFADNHDVATASLRDAVANNPNDPGAQMGLAIVLHRAGYSVDEVLERIDLAMRLSPRAPNMPRLLTYRALVLFNARKYRKSLDCARMANSGVYPSPGALPVIAASLSALGKTEEARAAIRDYLRASPAMSISLLRQKPWLGSPGSREPFLDALRDAGLPE